MVVLGFSSGIAECRMLRPAAGPLEEPELFGEAVVDFVTGG
jgi:hypothetical protein